jgi:DNA-directed RNA polymerase specialized sigma24 family protein
MTALKDFIDRYYPTVFTATARLTGSSDQEVLALLTENILVKLWQERKIFGDSSRPGVFLYRIVLQEVFSYLKASGDEERLRILRDILLIDPALYLGEPPEDPPDISPAPQDV